MVDPDDRHTNGAPPSHIHIEKKSANWLPWLLLGLALLAALLFLLSRTNHNDASATTVATTRADAVTQTTATDRTTVVAGTSALGPYLAGTEAAPRRFVFEKLNFDTASSAIRPADVDEVNAVAATLTQYPNARVRIGGYADARGSDAANAKLGQDRADSVKSALTAKGIDGNRIETGTGGEESPVDTNATAAGQFENRRTELTVTQR